MHSFKWLYACTIVCFLLPICANAAGNLPADTTFYNQLATRGAQLQNNGEYEKAIATFDSALTIAQSLNDLLKQAKMLDQIGKSFAWMGKSDTGLQKHLEALKIAEKLGNDIETAIVLKNIGALHVEQREYKVAMEYYDKAEKLARKANNRQLIADLTNNKGLVIETLGDNDKGLKMYLEAYKIYKSLNNEGRIAMAANNIGIVYKNKHDYPNALKYMEEAMNISEKMGNQWYVAATLTNMANVYSVTGNFMKAIDYANRAVALSKKIQAQEILVNAYMNLAYYNGDIKNYKKAFELMKVYDIQKDSLLNKERVSQMASMREKYETDKKQDTIRLLEQQRKINELEIEQKKADIKQQNTYWAVGIISILVIALVAWLLYNRQKIAEKARLEAEILRKENQLQTAVYEAEKAERTRIARDMHDELGSGLSKIAILTGSVLQKTNHDEHIGADVENISRTARSLVSNMSDLVWVLNTEDSTLDNLVARLREYTYDFLEDCKFNFEAHFPDETPNLPISKEVQRNLFLSYKEILNNTVKYSKAPQVNIEVKTPENNISISVSDNGVGFDQENARKYGNGLKNLKNRMEQIGGKYVLETAPGQGTKSQLWVAFTTQNTTKV